MAAFEFKTVKKNTKRAQCYLPARGDDVLEECHVGVQHEGVGQAELKKIKRRNKRKRKNTLSFFSTTINIPGWWCHLEELRQTATLAHLEQ